MDTSLRTRIDRLAADRLSGASELLPAAAAILRESAPLGPSALEEAAAAICRAQPSMASIWNAALVALTRGGTALDRFERRASRSTAAIARFAADVLAEAYPASPPILPVHIITISFSATVIECLRALSAKVPVIVACAEGRPALEGRRMASAVAQLGIEVELYTDAAIARAVTPAAAARARAVVVGADAIGPEWFINKCGTMQLAAAAAAQGISTYVTAGSDKFVPRWLASRLELREGPPDELWERPPDGVTVHNPYFERIPLWQIAGIFSDAGFVAAEMVAAACGPSECPAAFEPVLRSISSSIRTGY